MTDVQQVDDARTLCLCAAGAPGWIAATTIGGDGQERLVLIRAEMIGREFYDATCSTVTHEQLGALPIEFVRRIAIASRTRRCGRPTRKGRPCRLRVEAAGQACEWHRLATDDDRT